MGAEHETAEHETENSAADTAPGGDKPSGAGGRDSDGRDSGELPWHSGLEDMRRLQQEALAVAGDTLALVRAELRLFLTTVLTVVMLSAMAGLLLAGALMFLGASGAWALVSVGRLAPEVAGLLLALLLLLVTGLAWWWIRRITADLTFRESRRALRSLAALRVTPPREAADDTQAVTGAAQGRTGQAASDGPQDSAAR